MSAPVLAALVLLALGGIIVAAVIAIYNSLVSLRIRANNAWADIDVRLKRRHDLVPNLVETVRSYAGHERDTLEAVVVARNRAVAGGTLAARADAESSLASALRSVFALAVAYPQLRAAERFTGLQEALAEIEEAIQVARRQYNAVVRDLNTRVATFPSNLVARQYGFGPREFFELAARAELEPPQVVFKTGT